MALNYSEAHDPAKIVVSCVMDDKPKFHMQTWNWLLSLHACGAIGRVKPVIHFLGTPPDEFLGILKSAGAELCKIESFHSGTRETAFCNKLQQLVSPALQQAEYVILSDADIVFVEPPDTFISGEHVRAKVVDVDNPDEQKLRALLHQTCFKDTEIDTPPDFRAGRRTHRFNCNGGLYILPKSAFQMIAEPWKKWALFCLQQEEILGRSLHHSDQLGFMLAMLETNLPFLPLTSRENFPLHHTTNQYQDIPEQSVAAFHYHHYMDNHGRIARGEIPWINTQIDAANDHLATGRRTWFSNEVFWNFRYQHDPELGSGRGSRGKFLKHKQDLLRPFADNFRDADIVEVGFGDLETSRVLPFKNYLGIDASQEAVKIAAQKMPNWTFNTGLVDELSTESADLVICLDVLFHVPKKQDYENLISQLIRVSRKSILVSGHVKQEHAQNSGILFFHEPLMDTFKRMPGVSKVEAVGRYSDATLIHVEVD
jgi:2-polyprenyl-3-methyl-5-hydroxy-6-metoxy-1,4-benzoquinol methylase